MRRIQVVLAALAIVVTSLAAFAGPAMAQELDCRDAKGDLIRCDGDLYTPYDNNNFDYPFYDNNNYFDYDEDYYEDYFEDLEDYFEDYEDNSWGWNNYW